MRPVICAPLGITTLPSSWTGVARLAANVSPTLFLSVASVWPTVALIAVPFGTVTVAVCGALFTAAGFAVAPLAATALPASGFLVAGLAAAGLLAAVFAAAAFLAGAGVCFVAWSVAWFEQPASVKNAAAATARENLRRPSDLNISLLQSGNPWGQWDEAAGLTPPPNPFTDRNGGYPYLIHKAYKIL